MSHDNGSLPMSINDPSFAALRNQSERSVEIAQRGGNSLSWISVRTVQHGYNAILGPYLQTSKDIMKASADIKDHCKGWQLQNEELAEAYSAAMQNEGTNWMVRGTKEGTPADVLTDAFVLRMHTDLSVEQEVLNAIDSKTVTPLYTVFSGTLLPGQKMIADRDTLVEEFEKSMKNHGSMPLNLARGISTFSTLDKAYSKAATVLHEAQPMQPEIAMTVGRASGEYPQVGATEVGGFVKTLVILKKIEVGGTSKNPPRQVTDELWL